MSLNPRATIPRNTGLKTRRTEGNTTSQSATTITIAPSVIITKRDSTTTTRAARRKVERGERAEMIVICVE